MVLMVSMIASVVAGIAIEVWRYKSGKKENHQLTRGKIISDALEQALIIFLSAIFALWITNISETNRIKNQTKEILKASENELETVINAIWGGAIMNDQVYLGQLYTLVNYERVLDLRNIIFSDSVFIHLEPLLAANISRFETNYERDFQTLKTLLDESDGNTDGEPTIGLIYDYSGILAEDAIALIGMINQEISYLEGASKKSDGLYDPQMIPKEIQERFDIIIDYLRNNNTY